MMPGSRPGILRVLRCEEDRTGRARIWQGRRVHETDLATLMSIATRTGSGFDFEVGLQDHPGQLNRKKNLHPVTYFNYSN